MKRRLVKPVTLGGRRYRFAFNDLLVMRMAKELLRRRRHLDPVQRCFERVRRYFDPSRPMTSLTFEDDEGRIVVRDGNAWFEAESGQLLLAFEARREGGKLDDRFGPARVRERFEEAQRLAETDPLRALTIYSDVLGREPRNYEAHLELAELLEREGDLAGALRHLLGAAVVVPTNAQVHLRLGLLYLKRGDDDAALQSLLRAVQCDPLSAAAHRTLAGLYERMGRQRDALRHLSTLHRLTRPD